MRLRCVRLTRHWSMCPRPLPGRGKKTCSAKAPASWPRLLRSVRAWLTPAYWLRRCWDAFADTAPPAELAALLGALNAGEGINLYLRI